MMGDRQADEDNCNLGSDTDNCPESRDAVKLVYLHNPNMELTVPPTQRSWKVQRVLGGRMRGRRRTSFFLLTFW